MRRLEHIGIVLLILSSLLFSGCDDGTDEIFSAADEDLTDQADGDEESLNENENEAEPECPEVFNPCPTDQACTKFELVRSTYPECALACRAIAEPDKLRCEVSGYSGVCLEGTCVLDSDSGDSNLCPGNIPNVDCPANNDCALFSIDRAAFPDCSWYCSIKPVNQDRYCSIGGIPGRCNNGVCTPNMADGDLDGDSDDDSDQYPDGDTDDIVTDGDIDGDTDNEYPLPEPPILDLPADIPDNDPIGIGNEILLEGTRNVEDICIDVDIIHPLVSDLRIFVKPPSSDWMLLLDQNEVGENLYQTFRLQDLDFSYDGIWRMRVSDVAPSDIGNWVSWSIRVGCPEVIDGDDDTVDVIEEELDFEYESEADIELFEVEQSEIEDFEVAEYESEIEIDAGETDIAEEDFDLFDSEIETESDLDLTEEEFSDVDEAEIELEQIENEFSDIDDADSELEQTENEFSDIDEIEIELEI